MFPKPSFVDVEKQECIVLFNTSLSFAFRKYKAIIENIVRNKNSASV